LRSSRENYFVPDEEEPEGDEPDGEELDEPDEPDGEELDEPDEPEVPEDPEELLEPDWPAEVFGLAPSGPLRSHPSVAKAHTTASEIISLFMAISGLFEPQK
jgi:hypothetical protein